MLGSVRGSGDGGQRVGAQSGEVREGCLEAVTLG